MRLTIGVVLVFLLCCLPVFASGVNLITNLNNNHDKGDITVIKISWYVRGTAGNIDLNCISEDPYPFAIRPGITRTVSCKIEDLETLKKISGTNAYAKVDYEFGGEKRSADFGPARIKVDISFLESVSESAKSTVKKVQDSLANLLGRIKCDKTSGLCEAKGDYFCFLTDGQFKDLTVDAVYSVMDEESNRENLGKMLKKQIPEDSASMAMAGCLPKGVTADYFRPLLKKSGYLVLGRGVPGTAYLGSTSNSGAGVTAIVSNVIKNDISGTLKWYYKSHSEPDESYKLFTQCTPGKSPTSGGAKLVTIKGSSMEAFFCGSGKQPGFPFPNEEGSPWIIKVVFSGEEGASEKAATMIYGKLEGETGYGKKQDCANIGGSCQDFVCREDPDKNIVLVPAKGSFNCGDPEFTHLCCVPVTSNTDFSKVNAIYLEVGNRDCTSKDNVGKTGPNGNLCCLKDSDCSKAYSGVCAEGVCGENHECTSSLMPICSPFGCVKPKLCDGGKSCASADENEGVCKCYNGVFKQNSGLNPPQMRCCGDGTDDKWCNIGNGACVEKVGSDGLVKGVWFPDHCEDGIMDCDETGVDCGGADCGSCPKKTIDGRGGIKAYLYLDSNRDGIKGSLEDFFGEEGFSINVARPDGFFDKKPVESLGVVTFEDLPVSTYATEAVSVYSNWMFTTPNKVALQVKPGSLSEVGFGVQEIVWDWDCDNYDVAEGSYIIDVDRAQKITCRAWATGTKSPLADVIIGQDILSAVTGEDGVAYLLYDPNVNLITGMFASINLDREKVGESSAGAAYNGKSGGERKVTFMRNRQTPPSGNPGSTNTGESDKYWYVKSCSDTCAENGPCEAYRTASQQYRIYSELDAADLCNQDFIALMCSGIQLYDFSTDQTRSIEGIKQASEIDENGCVIGFRYSGDDKVPDNKDCECGKAPITVITRCTDSDNGLDYFTQGQTVIETSGGLYDSAGLGPKTQVDICQDNKVVEQFCFTDAYGNIKRLSWTYDCTKVQVQGPDGTWQGVNHICMDGACVPDCTKCGWFAKGILDVTCEKEECEALGSHCKHEPSLLGGCGFR